MIPIDNLRSALIRIGRLERKIESLKSKNKALTEKVKFQDRVFRYFPNAAKTKLLLEEVRNLQTELALRQRNKELKTLVEIELEKCIKSCKELKIEDEDAYHDASYYNSGVLDCIDVIQRNITCRGY